MKKIAALTFAIFALTACEDKPEYSVIGQQGNLKAIAIPAEFAADREYYQRIVNAQCPRSGICMLMFFTGLTSVSYPMSDAVMQAQTADYRRNPNSGLDRLTLACRLDEAQSSDCF